MTAIFIAFLSALLFGAAAPVGKMLLESLAPLQLAGLLYIGAALGVLPFSLGKGLLPGPMDKVFLVRLGGAVFFGGIIGPVLLLLGLKAAPAASVAMWLNLELVFTAVLGVWLFKEHLGGFGWLGVAGTLAASVLLSWHDGRIGILPLLLVAGASLAWALDNHFTALIDGITPSQSTFWKGIVAGLTNLCLSWLLESPTLHWMPVTLALAAGAVAYGFSITLYITAAQNLGATRSQMIFASAPFFGVALSMLLLGESLSGVQISSAAILAASLAVLFRDRHVHVHHHAPQVHTHPHCHEDGHHDHAHSAEEQANHGSHRHRHGPVSHRHPHWPDIHHRHGH